MIAVFIIFTAACGGTQAPAPTVVGDNCLVGNWTLQQEQNKSGYSYAGVPVAVAGLDGAKLTIKSDGTKQEMFDGSKPLVGTTAAGKKLVITITGSVTFNIHGDGHQYAETGSRKQVPTAATLDGVAIKDYQSSYSPAHGTYKCAGESLTTTTSTGLQTESWSRG